MPEMGAPSREVFALAKIWIQAPICASTRAARASDQNPIFRITKRGSMRIANITSAQMPGA